MERLTKNALDHLLHNKFVVIIGGSVMRAVYKDMVHLLQHDELVPQSTLKMKGEQSFSSDTLVHGGIADGPLHNGKNYCEVRQYCTQFHLVRFYFVTRCFSNNVSDVLEVLRDEPFPDVIIMNSCLWDLTRYGPRAFTEYKRHLDMLFLRIRNTLQPSCLFVWATTPPIGAKLLGGCLPSNDYHNNTLRFEVQAANFLAVQMADDYGFRILDMHNILMGVTQWRVKDGIHWKPQAHRFVTSHIVQMLHSIWDTEDFQMHFQGRMLDENFNCFPTEEEDRYGGPIRTPSYMSGWGGLLEHYAEDTKDFQPRFAGAPPSVKRPMEQEGDEGLGWGPLIDCLAQSASSSSETARGAEKDGKEGGKKDGEEKAREEGESEEKDGVSEKEGDKTSEAAGSKDEDKKDDASSPKKNASSPQQKKGSSNPKKSTGPEAKNAFKKPIPVKKGVKRLQKSSPARKKPTRRSRGGVRGEPRLRSVSCADQLLSSITQQLQMHQRRMPMGNSFSNRDNMAPNHPMEPAFMQSPHMPQGQRYINSPSPQSFFNEPPVPNLMDSPQNPNFISPVWSPCDSNFTPSQAEFVRGPCGPSFVQSPQTPDFTNNLWGTDFMRNPRDMGPNRPENFDNSPQVYNWGKTAGMGGPGPMRGWGGGRHRPY